MVYKMSLKFKLKQNIKSFFQNEYLPRVYDSYVQKTHVEKGKVIMADMHSERLPFSMESTYNALVKKGYRPRVMCRDFAKLTPMGKLRFLMRFMKEYASAEYVYICSYFLPVSSCKKRPETKVIQLWHSGGLLKKMGYDTRDDIPKGYVGDVTANYNLVTVSAEICAPIWEKALRLPKGMAEPLGLARTDVYFNDDWNERQRTLFYKIYPEAKGKKVALYAPSFSGNAATPKCKGIESGIIEVMNRFSDEWFFIVRLHPLLREKYPQYWSKNDEKMPTEKLLPIVNLLITDYSSVLFDYSIYKKPFVLFCPDIDSYKRTRGFYADPENFPAPLAKTADELEEILRRKAYFEYSEEEYEEFCKLYMGACDGNSALRIVEHAINSL